MGSCALCQDSVSVLYPTEIPKNKRESVPAFVCEECLEDIPSITGGEWSKNPTEWWHREAKDRYEPNRE